MDFEVKYHQTLGIVNAFLLDVKDMGFFNPIIPLKVFILKKSKIDRKKQE